MYFTYSRAQKIYVQDLKTAFERCGANTNAFSRIPADPRIKNYFEPQYSLYNL